jgi:hypothetical protein
MKKRNLTILIILIFSLYYSLMAFIVWELNIAEWHTIARALFIIAFSLTVPSILLFASKPVKKA